MKKILRIVGIMSGTSIDGIDYVLAEVKRGPKASTIKYIAHQSRVFPSEIKKKIHGAVENQIDMRSVFLLHHELGRCYAEQLFEIAKKKKWKFDAIGLHGQTVFHQAPEATVQIGEPSYLSAKFEVPVISDFRVMDLALGGQGAPLATLFHQVAFAPFFKRQVFAAQNLGGISNISYLSQSAEVTKSFDTGPANMLLDLLAQKVTAGRESFDRDGKLALAGKIHQGLVERLLQLEYFKLKPPKSCGREEFGENFFLGFLDLAKGLRDEDKMASLVEFTAKSIAMAYHEFCRPLPRSIVLCGGGSKNPFLLSRLQFHLPKCRLVRCEELGWPAEAIEGGAFALLAAHRLWGLAGNIPKTTGAKRSAPLGKIS